MDSSSSSSSSEGVFLSGMDRGTYFIDSPVVITVSGYEFGTSPIKMVVVEVLYNMTSDPHAPTSEWSVVGDFHADTGGSPSIDFDISSALRAIWNEYGFSDELGKATTALTGSTKQSNTRGARQYALRCHTEYIDSTDGEYTRSQPETFTGGECMIGKWTELERLTMNGTQVSVLENTNPRNGDASTKPRNTPELVGSRSITSWVDVSAAGTTCVFYPAPTGVSLPSITGDADSTSGAPNISWTDHSPYVLRDSVPYTDFLFVNRRGALETCSARMLEALDIPVEVSQYSRTGRPSFVPQPSVMAVATGGRRSWSMSSGHQTKEWAEWWVTEFLMAEKKWMRYNPAGATGTAADIFLPVTVQPAKKSTAIYDRTKQEMPSVEFTVTLALEG